MVEKDVSFWVNGVWQLGESESGEHEKVHCKPLYTFVVRMVNRIMDECANKVVVKLNNARS